MRHLNEAELVDHYYGESAASAGVERHLRACAECSSSYAALRRDLDEVRPLAVPQRGAGYGEEVWQSIRSALPIYDPPRRRWRLARLWKPMALSTTCALFAIAAFFSGRQWERHQAPAVATGADPQARQRVVVLVLGDHLDRSERLLVELNHADGRDPAQTLPIQTEARELLAANRLVRQSTGGTGNSASGHSAIDPLMSASLDHLERLLVEVANQPGGLTEADLNRIRQQMNTDGLLFDVRVLRSRVRAQRPADSSTSKGIPL